VDKGFPYNHLLNLLTPEAYARIQPKLKPRILKAREILYQPNRPIDVVYFPESSVICQLGAMADGSTIETATVGQEGASWISARIGAESMPCQTMVAIGGDAQTLSVGELDREIRENAPFADLLTRYSHALLIHSMRLTACAGLHTVKQRAARWVLGTLDQVSADRFRVTHDLMSMLLGVRRPSVSLVLEELEREGALTLERATIIVRSREQLVRTSCECYQLIKESYSQVEG
jgi:CRP-like cAMP-binding protein